MSNSFWRKSLCQNQYLHRFKITGEFDDGVLEVCEICKKTRFFKVLDGKVNNQSYMDWHIRSALTQNHPYYFHEFYYSPFAIESPYGY